MLVIGLTGGIGSGKSTVAQLFSQKGITVIDTDQLAREVTQIGTKALEKIRDQFGPKVINSDGTLDRNALRKIIFVNENARTWLENLLHPLIRIEMQKLIQNATSPYCIVVIPLLFETEPNPLIDRVLVVDTTEVEQMKRTQTRDNMTEEEVNSIIGSQITRAKRLSLAHDVILNTGTIQDLLPEIDRMHQYYLQLALENTQH